MVVHNSIISFVDSLIKRFSHHSNVIRLHIQKHSCSYLKKYSTVQYSTYCPLLSKLHSPSRFRKRKVFLSPCVLRTSFWQFAMKSLNHSPLNSLFRVFAGCNRIHCEANLSLNIGLNMKLFKILTPREWKEWTRVLNQHGTHFDDG